MQENKKFITLRLREREREKEGESYCVIILFFNKELDTEQFFSSRNISVKPR